MFVQQLFEFQDIVVNVLVVKFAEHPEVLKFQETSAFDVAVLIDSAMRNKNPCIITRIQMLDGRTETAIWLQDCAPMSFVSYKTFNYHTTFLSTLFQPEGVIDYGGMRACCFRSALASHLLPNALTAILTLA